MNRPSGIDLRRASTAAGSLGCWTLCTGLSWCLKSSPYINESIASSGIGLQCNERHWRHSKYENSRPLNDVVPIQDGRRSSEPQQVHRATLLPVVIQRYPSTETELRF